MLLPVKAGFSCTALHKGAAHTEVSKRSGFDVKCEQSLAPGGIGLVKNEMHCVSSISLT